MQAAMTPQQRREAKQEILEQIKQGTPVKQARSASRMPIHRATLYRLLKRVQNNEEGTVVDGRHAHPIKLRGEILALMCEHCQANPYVASSAVQHLLHERFGVSVSVSQLNRVRAACGLTRTPAPREKKGPKRASRLPQALMSRPVDCCCWQRLQRPTCSRGWSKPCHPQPRPQLPFP
jgi:transposase